MSALWLIKHVLINYKTINVSLASLKRYLDVSEYIFLKIYKSTYLSGLPWNMIKKEKWKQAI